MEDRWRRPDHPLWVSRLAVRPGAGDDDRSWPRRPGFRGPWRRNGRARRHAPALDARDRGLAGLAFADPGEEQAALADMRRRWPRATYVDDAAGTNTIAARVFDS